MYGLKLHLMVTHQGYPVAFCLTPGATRDVTGLLDFDFDLPGGALMVADKAYNNYEIEDVLETAGIHLRPMRKQNAKRPLPPWWLYLQARYRKAIATTGSLLQRLLPKSIHATSAAGFELKIVLFVLAISITCSPDL